MKLGFLELMDTSGLSEENKKFFESLDEKMGEAFEKQVKGYLADEVKLEDLRKSIKDAADSINDIKEKDFAGIDKKTFEEKVNELENAILRVKASTEVGKNGEVKIKSVYEQLHEQLKEYIAADKKGVMSLDLKSACQSAPGNKLGLNLVLEKKDAATITSGSLAPHYGLEVDPNLSVNPRAQTVIRKYANVSSTNNRALVYAEYTSKDGDAAWVSEGGLKPLMDATLTEKTITAAKVAITAKFTEETLSDFPSFVNEVETEMVNKLGIKEEQGILSGNGSGGEIKGVASDMPAFSLSTFYVEKPNMFDALVAGYSQIVSTSEMAYRPNLVLMNPLDYASMQLAKDANGQYLRPFRYGDELIQGLRVETTTAVKQGDFIMGDFSYLNIRDLWELSITLGWENDDFRKNIVTVIAEKRLMCYIKSQYKTAFVKDTFSTVIEGITQGA
jgi:HK97 family phage major capsid protein